MAVTRTDCERIMFQSSVRINVGPNKEINLRLQGQQVFQSSVRINVGPNFR